MMKLWLLRPIKNLGEDNPWDTCYEKSFGFVVRAETEEQARDYAHEDAGDENMGEFIGGWFAKTKAPWKDQRYSSCVELTKNGKPGIVMRDFYES